MPWAAAAAPVAGAALSSGKGAKAAAQSSKDAIQAQQNAMDLAFPPEIRAGRANVANGINQNVVGNFFGNGEGLAPTTGFRDINPNAQQQPFQGRTLDVARGANNSQEANDQIANDPVFEGGARRGKFFDEVKRIASQVLDPQGVVLGEPLLPDDTIKGFNINDPLGIGIGGEGGGIIPRTDQGDGGSSLAGLADIPQEQLVNFEEQGLGQLGQLNQLGQVPVDSRIDGLLNQQVGSLDGLGDKREANLQGLQQDLGNIGEQSQAGLQDLLNQNDPNSGRANGIGQFLRAAGGIAGGSNNAISQFTDPLQETLARTRDLNSQVQQDAKGLITANEEQSRFEEDNALVSLNDQLASRGLGSSSAAVDALTSAQQKFGRGRAQDAAKIRSQANQQQFQNQLGALNQVGRLASQGGQLQQQGLNTQLRGAGIGGQLLGQQTGQQQNLLSALGNQQNQNAQNRFSLQNQIDDNGFNTIAQQLGLIQGNEGRTQQNNQQAFSNQGAITDRLGSLISQLFGAGQASGGQAASISNQIGQQQSQNAIGQSRGSGQAFASVLSALGEIGKNNQNGFAPLPQSNALSFDTVDPNSGLSGNSFLPAGSF